MYDILAPFYDAVHADVREDIEFILEMAHAQSGDVLDLGCGTGRITLPLAQAGFSVTGVDNEQAMLDSAAQKLSAAGLSNSVQLILADMVGLSLPKRDFALAVVTQNTFMHLDEIHMRNAMRAIAKHLGPNGVIAIDVANPLQLGGAPDQPNFVLEREIKRDDGVAVLQYARWRNDRDGQVVNVEWRYVADDGDVVHAATKYHYYYPHTLQLLMSDSGLEWQAVYGDYKFGKFAEGSERLIILARQC